MDVTARVKVHRGEPWITVVMNGLFLGGVFGVLQLLRVPFTANSPRCPFLLRTDTSRSAGTPTAWWVPS